MVFLWHFQSANDCLRFLMPLSSLFLFNSGFKRFNTKWLVHIIINFPLSTYTRTKLNYSCTMFDYIVGSRSCDNIPGLEFILQLFECFAKANKMFLRTYLYNFSWIFPMDTNSVFISELLRIWNAQREIFFCFCGNCLFYLLATGTQIATR